MHIFLSFQAQSFLHQYFALTYNKCALIKSHFADFSARCMSVISARNLLVHVVLNLGSVTSEGVTELVRNSPSGKWVGKGAWFLHLNKTP